ncbi:MAG TPA: hypothetical protein PKB02_02460 [Anaerohalosphaeraceae bacterium]|nr:hypothetical protein [Anaerohalosphaeraceae bacterium]
MVKCSVDLLRRYPGKVAGIATIGNTEYPVIELEKPIAVDFGRIMLEYLIVNQDCVQKEDIKKL